MWLSRLLIVCGLLLAEATIAKEDVEYQVLDSLPHDASSFTQGLELHDGLIYESSGLYRKSRVRKYHPRNDNTLVESALADEYFAEGLTLLNDKLFVLTWKEGTLIVMNPEDLTIERELSYTGEGWGLANNGRQLIMSDGSDTIYFRNPATFEVEREIKVYSQQHSVQRINELEYAQGYIWANIWLSSLIVKINPQTGELAGFYDLQGLVKKHATSNDRVLNGIAYDADKKAFWITGKLWPVRYLVKFGRAQQVR